MKSAAVRQMIGYVLPTWYGYQGWGMLDYFVEQPARFTMTGAFHANHHALIHRLLTCFPGAEKIESVDPNGNTGKTLLPSPGDAAKAAGLTKNDLRGLLFDRDNVAFYGDPAWEARMAPGKLNWEQKLTVDEKHTHTLTITPLAGAETWSTVNKNGSQRGGRPIIQYLPFRIDPAKVKIESGSDLNPVIADDFILVPLPNRSSGPLELKFSVQS
jgi:zinc protease